MRTDKRGAFMRAIAFLLCAMPIWVSPAFAHSHSRYGGPSYDGSPSLNVTSSLVAAGGGVDEFSSARALSAMVGSRLTHAELAKLRRQYGDAKIDSWVAVFDFGVKDAIHIARQAHVKIPHGNLHGKALAGALVKTGVQDHTFYIEYMLDKLISHRIHERVMDDIDTRYGPEANADYHRISNQALYDLGHALGMDNVRLSSFH